MNGCRRVDVDAFLSLVCGAERITTSVNDSAESLGLIGDESDWRAESVESVTALRVWYGGWEMCGQGPRPP